MRQRERIVRSRKRSKRHSIVTVVWLLVLFPYGLIRMWGQRCRWHKAIKYAVTALYALLLLFVIVCPTPEAVVSSGITLCGDDVENEIYGPELPKALVDGYVYTPTESVILPEEEEKSPEDYVYSSKESKCYHLYTCKFAYAGTGMSLYEAYYLGKKPCNLCHPPVYQP